MTTAAAASPSRVTPFYALGTIVCIVQALVFVILAVTYVRMVSHAEY
jgi:F0F1-type ATP synthase membrane subunit a